MRGSGIVASASPKKYGNKVEQTIYGSDKPVGIWNFPPSEEEAVADLHLRLGTATDSDS